MPLPNSQALATAADTESLLAKLEKLLFEDDLSRNTVEPKWTTGKGPYLVTDGLNLHDSVAHATS